MSHYNSDQPIPEGYKRCGRRDKCVNPEGCVLPATTEFFHFSSRDGLSSWCKACDRQKKNSKLKDVPCPVCGKPVPTRHTKYCSRECHIKDPERLKGGPKPGSISWNTGLTSATDERIANAAKSKLKNVVDRNALFELYVEQNLPLRTIGRMYGVSRQVINRLASEFNLERIQPLYTTLTPEIVVSLYSQGLSMNQIGNMYECSPNTVKSIVPDLDVRENRNAAGVKPNPEILRNLYWDEWLGYAEIGQQLNVDMTTIPYWLKKFNIPRRTLWETRRGKDWKEPDVQVIIHLYEAEHLGTDTIGKLIGTSGTYVSSVLKQNNIKLRQSGYPNIAHYTSKDGHKVKSGLEVQVDDWLFERGINHIYEPFIGKSRYKSDFLINDIYIEIWGITGHSKYDEKRQTKLRLYQSLKLNLISVFPSDFPNLKVLSQLTENSL
jgi:hypothetical protein